MPTSEIKQNQIPNEPELSDLVNLLKKQIKLDINKIHIGTIQDFNATTQQATVTVNYKKTFFKPNLTGVYEPTLVDYPVLVDCPVVVLGGGSGAVTFPIAAGDECLILCNDRDIDNWFQGSSGAANATPRLHSTADAIALVGIRSLPNVIPLYSSDSVELRTKSGNARVSVKADGSSVKVMLGETVSLELTNAGKLTVINTTGEFVAALNTIITTATAAGFPLVVDPTALAIFQSFKA